MQADREEDENEDDDSEDGGEQRRRDRRATARTARTSQREDSAAEGEDGETQESSQRRRRRRVRRRCSTATRQAETREPWRPNITVLDNPEAFGYKVFTRDHDEEIAAEEPVHARRAGAAAHLPRQGAAHPVERRRAARQPAAAHACSPSRTAPGISISRKARSTPRGCRASSSIRCTPLSFKRERDTDFRDTVVTLLLDNSGSHARPPDHGRGLLRRHSGAHARALRRQGRDPRLHDPGLEGRPGARGVARRRQARKSRPPQRSAPHHLQDGGRAVAARQALARADDARRPAEGEHRRRGAGLGAPAPAWRGPSSAAF